MNIRQLKFEIITKILESDDPELLRAIQKLIELKEKERFVGAAAVFPETLLEQTTQRPGSEAVRDLQSSIDEIFGRRNDHE